MLANCFTINIRRTSITFVRTLCKFTKALTCSQTSITFRDPTWINYQMNSSKTNLLWKAIWKGFLIHCYHLTLFHMVKRPNRCSEKTVMKFALLREDLLFISSSSWAKDNQSSISKFMPRPNKRLKQWSYSFPSWSVCLKRLKCHFISWKKLEKMTQWEFNFT